MSPEVTKSLFFLFLRPHPLPTQSPYFSPGRSDLLFAPRDMSRWGGEPEGGRSYPTLPSENPGLFSRGWGPSWEVPGELPGHPLLSLGLMSSSEDVLWTWG